MSCQHKAVPLLSLAAALLFGAHTLSASAETIVVNGQVAVVKSTVPRPGGGMTMKAVEAHFGAPRERHETVGKPPITRWDYDRFAVFFEKDRVIDAVVTDAASPASPSAPDTAPASAPAPAQAVGARHASSAAARPAPRSAAAPSTPMPKASLMPAAPDVPVMPLGAPLGRNAPVHADPGASAAS
jgi:hypothetical protein